VIWQLSTGYMFQPEKNPPVCHLPSSLAAWSESFTVQFNQVWKDRISI